MLGIPAMSDHMRRVLGATVTGTHRCPQRGTVRRIWRARWQYLLDSAFEWNTHVTDRISVTFNANETKDKSGGCARVPNLDKFKLKTFDETSITTRIPIRKTQPFDGKTLSNTQYREGRKTKASIPAARAAVACVGMPLDLGEEFMTLFETR